jgi:hypothetical protein
MEKNLEIEVPDSIPQWRLLIDQSRITQDVVAHEYEGSGTEEDPFIVNFLSKDTGNPMQFPSSRKWFISMVAAMSMLATAFVSSAFSGRSSSRHFAEGLD